MDDYISRQAALDAILHNQELYSNNFGNDPIDKYTIAIIDNDAKTIAQLPSAQPGQRWIPCSERLPEHGGRYLISVLDGINRRTTVAPYLPRCKAWTMTGRMAYWKVIAWMPLPEPYKEERKDDEQIRGFGL